MRAASAYDAPNNIKACSGKPSDIDEDCGVIHIKAKEGHFEADKIIEKIVALKIELIKLFKK